MSAKVDVLAVMDRTASHEVSFLCKIKSSALSEYEASARQARAAVAELIEAAEAMANDQVHSDLDEPDYERENSDAAASRNNGQRIYWRLRAALANIGPKS